MRWKKSWLSLLGLPLPQQSSQHNRKTYFQSSQWIWCKGTYGKSLRKRSISATTLSCFNLIFWAKLVLLYNLIQKGGKSWLLIASIVMFEGMTYIQKMLSSPFFILISFFIFWSEKIPDLVKPELFNSILVYCEDRTSADLDTSWKDINKKISRSINFYYYIATRTTSWKKTVLLRICRG